MVDATLCSYCTVLMRVRTIANVCRRRKLRCKALTRTTTCRRCCRRRRRLAVVSLYIYIPMYAKLASSCGICGLCSACVNTITHYNSKLVRTRTPMITQQRLRNLIVHCLRVTASRRCVPVDGEHTHTLAVQHCCSLGCAVDRTRKTIKTDCE